MTRHSEDTGRHAPTGMTAFTIVWVGQIVSLLGTAMSGFALTLWAYESTARATPLAMIGFFFVGPQVLLAPFVGVLVDRANRKLMMLLSDLAAALATACVLALYARGELQVWHLYVSAAVSGTFQGFQWPAYSAAITLMLPKEHYARANGMLDMAGNASAVFAPILAGVLIGPVGLVGILAIDLASAAVAIGSLLFVRIPQPTAVEIERHRAGGTLAELAYGFRYVFARPSLLGLQLVFLCGNLFSTVAEAVLAPMILARTGNDRWIYGSVQSAGAVGGVVGALAMSAWGGPRRRVHGVLQGWAWAGLLGLTLLGLGRSLPVWAAGMFSLALFSPLLNGCNQAIWQAKVPPGVQGRVFSARLMIAWLVMPISRAIAGPLADRVLEPAMAGQSELSRLFGWLVGTGTGAGMALLFVFAGLFVALTGFGGYLFPVVRRAEDMLPDHDVAAA